MRRWVPFFCMLAVVLAVGACSRDDDAAEETAAAPAPPLPPIAPAPRTVRYTVCLQPLGTHEAALLAPVERAIGQAYGFAVRRLAPRPLPGSAWYPPRSRYRADALLEHLLYDVMPDSDGCHAVVGVTSVDVSATKGEHEDWGVLGLAFHGGRVAVVSSHRLRRGVDAPKLTARMVKVVLHELGHVIGVAHREDGDRCLMNDAVGAVATIDRAEGAMCAPERADAERFLGFRLPVVNALDWPAILADG